MTLTELVEVRAYLATGAWRIAFVKHSNPRAGDPQSRPMPIEWTLAAR